jgi:hypothetical protein
MNKQQNADKNECEEDLPMDPLVPQAPKSRQDAVKKKPSDQADQQKQRAEAEKMGEQSLRSGLLESP